MDRQRFLHERHGGSKLRSRESGDAVGPLLLEPHNPSRNATPKQAITIFSPRQQRTSLVAPNKEIWVGHRQALATKWEYLIR